MTREQLEIRGWTPENLRKRMAGCLAGSREAKARGGSAVWTYRFLFARLYLGYKRDLATLTRETVKQA